MLSVGGSGISFFKELISRLSGRRTDDDASPEAGLDAWRVVHVENDALGQDLVARVRVSKPRLPSGARFDTAVMVEWAYEEDARSLPLSDTTESMTEFERAIDPLTAENDFAELVSVRTGLGVRQWLFYTGDRARFLTEFNQAGAGHPPYPVEVAFDEDPGWSLWKELLDDLGLR